MAGRISGLTIGEALGTAVLGVWLAATIFAHGKMVGHSPLRWLDPLMLIPDYRFFAPHPGVVDYHLLVRYRGSEARASDWEEISIFGTRGRGNWLWNPYRRHRKAFFDITGEIARFAMERPGEPMENAVAYVLVLNAVSERPRPASARAIQFLVMGCDPSQIPKNWGQICLSAWHGLEE